MNKKNRRNDTKKSGDTITIGDISGQGIAVGKNISIKVTLGSVIGLDEIHKNQIESLIQNLNEALSQVSKSKVDEATAVAKTAQTLIEVASEQKPNKPMLEITGDALKQAAKNIADVAPSVLQIASQIVSTIMMATNK